MAYAKDTMTLCFEMLLLFGRDYHCGYIGYQVKKKPRPNMIPHGGSDSRLGNGIYQPVILGGNSSSAVGTKASSAAGAGRRDSSNQVTAKSGNSVSSFHENPQGKK